MSAARPEAGPDIADILESQVYPALGIEKIYRKCIFQSRDRERWRGAGPFRESKSGTSFVVSPQTWAWWDEGLRVGGGPLQFRHRLNGGNGDVSGKVFVDIAKELFDEAGVSFPERDLSPEEALRLRERERRAHIMETLARICAASLWTAEGEVARGYLNDRGLSDEAIKALGLGLYHDHVEVRRSLEAAGVQLPETRTKSGDQPELAWSNLKPLEGYAIFPWLDAHGRGLTMYGRWAGSPPEGKPKTWALAGVSSKRSPLYLDRARKAGVKHVRLVEGVLDAAVAHAFGDASVVACVAASLSKEQAATLSHMGIEAVTVCLDPDSAGENGAWSCIKSLAQYQIDVYIAPKLPDGLDPDEFILRDGMGAWHKHCGQANHSYRWVAEKILSLAGGATWTDQTIQQAWKKADEFANSCTFDHRRADLDRFFWPAIRAELPEAGDPRLDADPRPGAGDAPAVGTPAPDDPSVDACFEQARRNLAPTPRDLGDLPRIQIGDRQLRDLSLEALRALQAANDPPELFARSGDMVAVVRDEHHRHVIKSVNDDRLIGYLTRSADYYRLKVTKDGVRELDCSPPRGVADDILSMAPEQWGFQPLDGVTNAPVLRPNGTILTEAGYDAATRLFYSPDPYMSIPAIPDQPSPPDAAAALQFLKNTIGEFPYADEASRTNAIAALLTPIVKPAIDAPAPLGLFDAPVKGTGKSLLCDVIAIIATGQPGEMFSAPKDEDEWRKCITTALVSGTPVVIFDNIVRPLDNADLCSVLTSTLWADRAMRTHSKLSLRVTSSFYASGNNIRLGGDVARRCYHIRMDAKCSSPFLREGPTPDKKFTIDNLKAHIAENRGELLASLLTIARAWYVAGKPKPRVKPVGSFEAWTITVGGILENAGAVGFLDNMATMLDVADDESREWEVFLTVLDEVFYGESFSTAKIVEKLNDKTYNQEKQRSIPTPQADRLRTSLPGALAEALDREGSFVRRAGKAFAGRVDRRFGISEVHIKRGEISHQAQLWRIAKKVVGGVG